MPNEVTDVNPTSLRHLVGQKGVIAQVSTALDAAFQDHSRFDHALLVGPPGLGKSQLANVIAQEMAVGFHELLGQSVSSLADLHALLLSAEPKDILHLDEAHELERQLQTALYLALDKRVIHVNSRQTPQGIPIADFTLLLSTTDEYALLPPLRDRMRLLLRFEYYSEEELTLLLRQRAHGLGWSVDEGVLLAIASRARGTPRLALRLLQSCRRVARAVGETTITAKHWEQACRLEQIDDLGLGPVERRYLSFLEDGPNRLNVLASMLGLPTRTVSEVTEQFLVRSGLVMKDRSGLRQLTEKGLEHVRRWN